MISFAFPIFNTLSIVLSASYLNRSGSVNSSSNNNNNINSKHVGKSDRKSNSERYSDNNSYRESNNNTYSSSKNNSERAGNPAGAGASAIRGSNSKYQYQ
jgi:hypothetical protein